VRGPGKPQLLITIKLPPTLTTLAPESTARSAAPVTSKRYVQSRERKASLWHEWGTPRQEGLQITDPWRLRWSHSLSFARRFSGMDHGRQFAHGFSLPGPTPYSEGLAKMPKSTRSSWEPPACLTVRHSRGPVRVFLALLSCCSVLLATCNSQTSEPEPMPVVQLSEHEHTIWVDYSLHLDLLPPLPPGYVPSVTWSSSNPAVASVEPVDSLVGLVRGLSPGQVVILVSGEGASDSATVVVTPPERYPVVQLLERTATLVVGDSVKLYLLPMLPPGYVPPVTWSSSNPEIASVESPNNGIGLVRGLSPGQAVILVSGEGKSDSARVVVTPPTGA
jgi:hypothetical protein